MLDNSRHRATLFYNSCEAKFICIYLVPVYGLAPRFITAFLGYTMHKRLDAVALTGDHPEVRLRKGDAVGNWGQIPFNY